jgi:hypothetical protein
MKLWWWLACAKEAYHWKAEIGSLGPPEARDALKQEPMVVPRNSHLPSADRD